MEFKAKTIKEITNRIKNSVIKSIEITGKIYRGGFAERSVYLISEQVEVFENMIYHNSKDFYGIDGELEVKITF